MARVLHALCTKTKEKSAMFGTDIMAILSNDRKMQIQSWTESIPIYDTVLTGVAASG